MNASRLRRLQPRMLLITAMPHMHSVTTNSLAFAWLPLSSFYLQHTSLHHEERTPHDAQAPAYQSESQNIYLHDGHGLWMHVSCVAIHIGLGMCVCVCAIYVNEKHAFRRMYSDDCKPGACRTPRWQSKAEAGKLQLVHLLRARVSF